MNPAELSQTLLALVRRAVAERGADPDLDDQARRRDAGAPQEPRARRLGVERRHEARQALGVNPRDFAAELAELLAATPGIAATEVAGPGFLNITLDAAAAGALAQTHRRGGRRLRPRRPLPAASRSTSSSSPRTRPGRSTSAASRWAAVGDSLARMLRVAGRPRHARVLLQRPRQRRSTASRAACVAAHRGEPAPEDGYGGDYILEIAARVEARLPRRPRRPPARGAAGGLPRARRRPHVRRDQGEPARLRRRLRRLLPRERPARVGRRRARDRRGCASSATSTRPTARSGCARPSSATTRTASSSRATASRPTSPATSPTT